MHLFCKSKKVVHTMENHPRMILPLLILRIESTDASENGINRITLIYCFLKFHFCPEERLYIYISKLPATREGGITDGNSISELVEEAWKEQSRIGW